MCEKRRQLADIYLDSASGEFHFLYGDKQLVYGKTLEELLEKAAENLTGRSWFTQQQNDLLVTGETSHHQYILNEPSDEAVRKLAEEYGGHELQVKNVSKLRLRRVTVRNMRVEGRESIVLEAYVICVESTHGYCRLSPTYLNLNTRELYDVMSVLMKLKMLKVRDYPKLKWLRRMGEKMPRL